MKKILSLALSLMLALTFAACGGASENGTTPDASGAAGKTPQDFKKFKIGIAEVAANDESVARYQYYNNFIAPTYNVEFIFSEQLTNPSEQLLTFIENSADAGCDAIISYTNDDIEQITQICAEYGMHYVVNTVRINPKTEAAFTGGYDNFAPFGNDQPYLGETFYNWISENATADGSEGFMITSGLAFAGNLQQTEITMGCLRALQDLYGLTYDQDIQTLTTSSSPVEATNDKGINIYVYPNVSARVEGWLQGVSAALQTSKYKMLIGSTQIYNEVAVVVDEVEGSLNQDIKVASVATISPALKNAFSTQDRFGNPSINMATAKPGSVIEGSGFVQCYNLLTGFGSTVLAPNGEVAELNSRLWPVYDLESLEIMSQWDVNDKWIFGKEQIDSMLGIYHPELTNADQQAFLETISYESTLERFGK